MKSTFKPIAFFLLITIVAFLPFTSFLFALKNDAFTGYFPPKFFMSEAIHAGYLPIWNPYINYGLPQYGDMSSGFWSPITWLLASTVGYNVYSFTLEEACYIFLAGLGMYYLTSYWGIKNKVRLMAGVAYMCSGYIVGHLQHFNWVSGAAFLPWCLLTYLQVLRKISLPELLKLALSFSLFFSSAHPGLIIGGIYFFIGIGSAYYFNQMLMRRSPRKIIGELIAKQVLILTVICIFICGPILGYLEILPHISRADKLSVDAIAEPANLQTWISLLLPLSTTKNDGFFATDISIRNSYFGLLFLLMFLTGLIGKKTKWQQLLLMSGLFFLLLSIGGIFKDISFNYFPLIGYVRLTGEFRIFAIFSFILFSAIQLNKWEKEPAWIKLRPAARLLLSLLGIALLLALYEVAFQHQSIFFTQVMPGGNWRERIKLMIENLTIYDTILLQGTLQISVLLLLVYALKNSFRKLLFCVVITELVLASLFNIPFTGVGKASARDVQQILNNSPRGIPVPPLQPTTSNSILPEHQEKMLGDWSFYNKQLGAAHRVPYPINLKNTDQFFQEKHIDEINRKSYLYAVENNSIHDIAVTHFTPSQISINVNAASSTQFVYKQNYYPYWKSTVNATPTPIQKSEHTFLSVHLKPGQQIVTFQFTNNRMAAIIGIHLLLCILACVILIVRNIKFGSKR